MSSVWLGLALLAAAHSDTIHAGSPLLRPVPLDARHDTTDVLGVAAGQERLVALTIRDMVGVSLDGRQTLLVVIRNLGPQGPARSVDSIWLEPRTLATVQHRAISPSDTLDVRVTDGHYRGTRRDSAGSHPIDYVSTPGAFDFSIGDLVVERLPLRAGYGATLDMYDAGRGQPVKVGVQVGALEAPPGATGDQRYWKVVMDYGTHQFTEWLDPSTQQLRQGVITMAQGREMRFRQRVH
jgi:hypothetical protein